MKGDHSKYTGVSLSRRTRYRAGLNLCIRARLWSDNELYSKPGVLSSTLALELDPVIT